jgi:hypothetical protein
MNKLYFLVILIMSFATQAQIINFPDANFKAKLLSGSDSNNVASTDIPDNLDSISNFTFIDINNNGEIEESEAALITYLNVSNSNITNLLGIEYFTNLQILNCSANQLTHLNASTLSNLKKLNCSDNQLTNLNVTSLSSLNSLNCAVNQLTILNINELDNLKSLNCTLNQLNTLNVTELYYLKSLYCEENSLVTLFIKNNNLNWDFLYFNNNPNLQYICCDVDDIPFVQQSVNTYGLNNCVVNSYCSFTPGGTYFTIQGNSKIDSNSNGCDISDIDFPFLKFNQIVSNNLVGVYFANQFGNYSIPVQAGSHTITPILENPTYFNISPTSFVADFPTQASPLVQDFCVTPNGVHHNVEVTIIPTNPARPGFDANYTIIYKNKGNQIENGAATLDFDDAVLDFVSATPATISQQPSTLTWNYTNLQPFETRTIDLVFNVNGPIETPAVNIGDVLEFSGTITPLTTDEFQFDNTSNLKQIVVGSYDPNDKTCVEGTTVGPDMIGQYVHYIIRFENTGTFAAENVVIKDMIDLAKFDVSTLIPLHSSHDFVTRISGNKVEFIFEGINLPFDDANNDGYVVFKIKTTSNLVVGNIFSNDANIYFDYNFPITTNTFTTTIAALSTTDFDYGTHFTLYPNPVKDVLNFQSKDNTTINSIEIYNTLGNIVLAVTNAISTVDVSRLQSGNYFVKVNTNLGVSNTKFIKE